MCRLLLAAKGQLQGIVPAVLEIERQPYLNKHVVKVMAVCHLLQAAAKQLEEILHPLVQIESQLLTKHNAKVRPVCHLS